ncbi:TIGR03089 family protein [Aeromicrobium sp.]|uniref:TIGR03089 family protein n=1 Tax=Aeromicrobium sp. TaxID=1871063 RepID=UPI003C58B47A
MKTLDHLLSASPDPSQPLVTFYDMATGERVELSTVTMANWVAKTSNFLVDDLDATLGTRIRLGLPSHWLTMVWILSAWKVGAAIVDDAADIGVSGPDLVADESVRVAASLRPLGGRFPVAPEGFLDLGAEVPGHGDHFMALDLPGPDSVALDLAGSVSTHAELLTSAPPSSDRRLVTPGTTGRDAGLIVGACLGGGSLVIVSSASAEQISAVRAQEGAHIH